MKTSKSKRESGAASAADASAGKASPAKASATGRVSRKAAQKAVEKPAKVEAPAKADAAPSLVLASHCSLKDAAAFKSSLLQSVDESATVAIDVRSLERVDTATMQLLCAFVRDRKTQEKKIEWVGESAALHEAARLLGVGALLDLPAVQASGDAA